MESTVLISLPIEDLQVLIIDCVNSCLKHVPEKSSVFVEDQRFHGDKALAAYLSCSVQTINQLKKKGQITFHRLGRRCYYLRSEIDTSLQVQSRKFGQRKK
jgi:excisionase family DNA binding protein